jgi:IQ and AAA domain-containing protein
MSSQYYCKMWVATQRDLKNALLRERVLPQLKPTMNRNYAHRLMGSIYAQYVVLVNNLSELYDQTLQVQKRRVIEKMLISSTNRLFELQKEMQKIEMSEFVFVDDGLIEMKLTPQNIEFLRPFYFPRKRDVEAQRVIDEIPSVIPEVIAPTGLDRFRKVLTAEEVEAKRIHDERVAAAKLIKVHEKAKQGRILFYNINHSPKKFKPEPREPPSVDYEFMHSPDQIPLYRIKRIEYKTDLYKKKMNVAKFEFYEPPVYRENKLGQLVLVPKKKASVVQVVQDDEEPDDEELEKARKKEEAEKIEAERAAEEKRRETVAALVIQRYFRCYLLRRASNRRNLKRMEICGVIETPPDLDKPNQKLIDKQRREKRRERKKEFDESFVKALEDEKARILKLKSEFIMEDISDDIRQWFREFFDEAQDFHRYPEEFEGGTIMVLRGETMTSEEFLVEKAKTPADFAKEKANKKKKRIEAKKKKKLEDKRKKKEEKSRLEKERKIGPEWDFSEDKYKSKNLGEFCGV